MENNLVISVITPSFNQGRYLAETIESVLGQGGDFYLDYVIVDGGSTDDSVEIIKRYEQLLNEGTWRVKCKKLRYRWMSEKDKGQTDALAKGFRLTEGEILAWINSDDVYTPKALEAVASFFKENPETNLLYGDAEYCDAEGKVVGTYPVEDFDLCKLAWFNFFCQPSTFFRKEAFIAVGGLDVTLHYAMDYDLFIKIGKQSAGRHLPKCLSRYRLHETSKSVREDVLYKNHEESLHLALKHYGWAPVNRVYGSCYHYCLAMFPQFLTKLRFPVAGAALLCTMVRSIWLNKGLRLQDLRLLNMSNMGKLFRDRMEILRGK